MDGNAEISEDAQRLLPVAACLAGLPEGIPGTAEAAVSTTLLVSQTDPGRQAEGSGKLGTGIAGPPRDEKGLAQAVECVDFTGPAAGLAKHAASPPLQANGPAQLALVQRHRAEFAEHVGHLVEVACLAGKVHGLLQVTGSLRVAALPHGHDAQVAQRANRARAVTLRAVQVQGLLELG